MNKKTMKRMGAMLLCLAMVCTMSGVFAYFTDRAEVSASVTGGTVGIDENATENWLSQIKDGPQDLDNINPGDSRSLAFTVTNTGNKAIDVRHTLKLSVVDALGAAKELSMGSDIEGESMLQFDIFKASDVVTMSNANNNAGYVLKDGASPVFSSDSVNATTMMGASRTVDLKNGVVTYYFADTVLDGVGDNAETNYAKAEHVDTSLANTDAKLNGNAAVDYDYILIFRDTTLNDFQGCKLHLELVVEAKQHLNTKSSWKNIETVEYNMVVSGVANQNTQVQTGPNNQTGVLEDVNNASASAYNGTSAP